MKIAVAGTWYVGLSIATLLAQHNKVIAVDIIPKKVKLINDILSPIKDEYIKKYFNHEILYLWEDDIYNNLLLCKRLIQKYISTNGILENYHSFNYHLENDSIVLNSSIILPYF